MAKTFTHKVNVRTCQSGLGVFLGTGLLYSFSNLKADPLNDAVHAMVYQLPGAETMRLTLSRPVPFTGGGVSLRQQSQCDSARN